MAVSEARKRANAKWNAEKGDTIGVRIKREEKDELRTICEAEGLTLNGAVLHLIRQYIAAHTDAPAPLPLPTGWEQTAPSVLRTLRTPDGWQLDLDDDGRAYGAWLSHPSCSVKAFLAGADKSKHTLDEFTALILNEIQLHIRNYKRDYMD